MAKSWIAICVFLFEGSEAVRTSQGSDEFTQSDLAEDSAAAFADRTDEDFIPFIAPHIAPKAPIIGVPPLRLASSIPASRAIPLIRPLTQMAMGPSGDESLGKKDTQKYVLHEEEDPSNEGTVADKQSYYKTIDGIKYKRRLLEMAEDFAKDGQISYAEAKLLWEDANDGKGMTDIEKETLMYTLANIKFTIKARAFLESQLDPSYDGGAYYKEIDGVKYDRMLLEKAELFAKDGQISYPEANELWEDAKDGKMVAIDCEKRTFEYMLTNLKFTDKAKKFIESQLKPATDAKPYYLDIEGVKYDRELVEKAESFAKDGLISIAQAKQLLEDAQDGKRVSLVERRTLKYTLAHFKYSDEAKTFMQSQLEAY